jgi:pimeloyl-ACP methyl ester carboxylesterase
MPIPGFTDQYWTSPDGLRLHYRDYAAREGSEGANRPPILCLPGLTRNARDFEPVAEAFAGDWRVICPDLRGRGNSEYSKDPQTYAPRIYIADLEALFLRAGLTRFVAIGTSLGGLLTMLLSAGGRERLAGAVLNDVGPVVEREGLARIRDYVGKGNTFPTWMHAARAIEETMGHAFPDYGAADWLVLAKRMMELGGNGRIAFDYDMKIAEPFARANEAPQPDLWQFFEALSGCPVLTLRGELSDILSVETLAEMQRRMPTMEAVTLPRIGHAPTLAESAALEAIGRLLAKVC